MSKIDWAKHALKRGAQYPYDAPDGWWKSDKSKPPKPKDWAHAAARGILADLTDRAGIKHGFGQVDEDVRRDIVGALAAIIREATGGAA